MLAISSLSGSPLTHGAGSFAIGSALLERLAFVFMALTLADANLHLDPSPFQVQAQRNQGVALPIRMRLQTIYLETMKQETSLSIRIVVESITMLVGRNIQTVKPDLSVFNARKTANQTGMSAAD